MNYKIEKVISEKEISKRAREIAEQINKDYEGETVHLVGILKGSVMFLCELSKYITVAVTMDFMSCSSYGDSTTSTGHVKLLKDLDQSIEGKNVIIVEDIVDTGHTLKYLLKVLALRKPKTLKVCTLLDKPSRREVKGLPVDYTGFEVENKFIVGYGLDFEQKYRNLPYVGVVEFEEE